MTTDKCPHIQKNLQVLQTAILLFDTLRNDYVNSEKGGRSECARLGDAQRQKIKNMFADIRTDIWIMEHNIEEVTIKIGGKMKEIIAEELREGDFEVSRSAKLVLQNEACTVSPATKDIHLVILTLVDLDLRDTSASRRDVYDRAQKIGFDLVLAEVGPQFALQYKGFEMYSYYAVGMQSIHTDAERIFTIERGGVEQIEINTDKKRENAAGSATGFYWIFQRKPRLNE